MKGVRLGRVGYLCDCLGQKKKYVCFFFPVTRPTLIFPSDPKDLLAFQKNKILSYATYPICGHFFYRFATFPVIFVAVLLFKHLF